MTDINKHPALRKLYEAALSLERLPASSEQTATAILLADASRAIDALVDSAVDVMAVVREYVEASEAFDAAYTDPAAGVELGKRLDEKWTALRALVSPTTGQQQEPK